MLPFLQSKKQAPGTSQILQKDRAPDNPEEKDDPKAYLRACATDLIDAVHARDIDKVAQILEDTFQALESQPHDEYNESEEGQE